MQYQKKPTTKMKDDNVIVRIICSSVVMEGTYHGGDIGGWVGGGGGDSGGSQGGGGGGVGGEGGKHGAVPVMRMASMPS